MTKITIEAGTAHEELTDEQGSVVDSIHAMVGVLQDMVAGLKETIDYYDPRLHHTDEAGYWYTITVDISKFHRFREQVNNMHEAYTKAVVY